MKIKKLLFASALLFSAYNASAQTQVIAHRGFWKTEGSAQNSIAALLKADSIGCYGSEFDVWLAADDQLVVNHDPTFKGKRMENSPSTALTAIKLDNGESLPTLAKYLKAAQPLHTRLILELKAHSTPLRETKAIEKIVAWSKTWDWRNGWNISPSPCMPPKNLSAWLRKALPSTILTVTCHPRS